ncbi:PAS domain-containing protein [Francisella philomiragia]|uniref:PAS domain-containing protein n=1 Tax=Francisella philomiragia TaxID=28110 RepID=UPI0035168CAB
MLDTKNIFNSLKNLESHDIFVFIKDVELRYTFASNNILKLIKFKEEDFLNKTDYDFEWGEKQADLFRSDDLSVLDSGIENVSEYLLNINNKNRWIKTYKNRIVNAHGKIVGILAIAYDVTQIKLVKIRKSEQLRYLSSPASSISKDISYYIENINQKIEKISKLSKNYLEEYISITEYSLTVCYLSKYLAKLTDPSSLREYVNINDLILTDLLFFYNIDVLYLTCKPNIKCRLADYILLIISFCYLRETYHHKDDRINIDVYKEHIDICYSGDYTNLKRVSIFNINLDEYEDSNIISTIFCFHKASVRDIEVILDDNGLVIGVSFSIV